MNGAGGDAEEIPEGNSSRPDSSLRVQQARVAAHESWAKTENRSERTRKPREAFERSFYSKVDPDNLLHPDERERRAQQARKAHFARMALRSAQARRRSG